MNWIYRDERRAGMILRAIRRVGSALFCVALNIRSHSRRMLVDPDNARLVVSLTTHGERLDLVHLTVESIGRGRVRPGRLILWLDESDQQRPRPAALKRAEARGLEVRSSENYGPHTKYLPAVQQFGDMCDFLVTADDDILYPRFWLSRLYESSLRWPDEVLCFRAHQMVVERGSARPYLDWPRRASTASDESVFATGVSGVLYPRSMISALRSAGQAFEHVARPADDVWLHHVALRNGVPVRQIGSVPLHFLQTPGTRGAMLASANVEGGRNDSIISQLYEPEDLRVVGGISD
jgi:hypothetical protein